MIKKLVNAFRLYRFGMFRIYINKLFPQYFQYHRFLIYRHHLNKITDVKARDDIQFAKITDIKDELFEIFRRQFPANEFRERLNNKKHECYVAMKEDEVAGYGWVAREQLFLDSVEKDFKLKKEEVFIHSCYVLQKFRGFGIYPAMLSNILQDCKEEGIKSVFIGVDSSNNGSKRGIEKAGFEYWETLKFLKLAGFRKHSSFKKHENPA